MTKPSCRRSQLAWLVVLIVLPLVAPAWALAAAGPAGPTGPVFPPALESYAESPEAGLVEVLRQRVRQEPLNLIATLLFFAAIVHTLVAPKIAAYAHHLQHRAPADLDLDGVIEPHEGPIDRHSFRAEMLHFLGEIEAVFGLWVVPLLAVITLNKGWATVESFISRVHFTEPMFVVVIMAIAGSRPVLELAERMIGGAARLGGGSPMAWWLAILTLGPVLGSLITEPAAMVISALLLSRRLYRLNPSPRLAYATLGLLFVNVSVGGTLTNFAAPPVLMVAGTWGWGAEFMLANFGIPALSGIVVANLLYALAFRRELTDLSTAAEAQRVETVKRPVPLWVTAAHLGFLGWTVFTAHSPALFIGGFLFFLAFTQASAPHQSPIGLRSPLLVGFFLGGLVVHGSLQAWWIAPVLGRLSEVPLFFGAAVLTAFNDNAAITYLASLVPSFSDEMKLAVVAGAVTGGGLTVIANAPNPAGQAILGRHFGTGISPLALLAGALVPTIVMAAAFLLLQ